MVSNNNKIVFDPCAIRIKSTLCWHFQFIFYLVQQIGPGTDQRRHSIGKAFASLSSNQINKSTNNVTLIGLVARQSVTYRTESQIFQYFSFSIFTFC